MSPPRHRIARGEVRRPLLLGVVALSLVLVAILSSLSASTATHAPPRQPVTAVATPTAESSSFTCGGMSVGPGSSAAGIVLLTNSSLVPVPVTLRVVDDAKSTVSTSLVVGPGTTASYNPSAVAPGGSWLAVLVLVRGGGVGVDEQIDGSSGQTIAGCASSTSSQWYLGGGSTADGQGMTISLINPSATSAVADVSFVGAQGLVAPQDAQGLVVPAGGIVDVSARALAPHIDDLGTIVSATQGSIVAYATQVSPAPAGVAVLLGEASTQTSWTLARAVASPQAVVNLDVVNPTDEAQTVTAHIRLASGWVAPWQSTVAPYSTWTLTLSPATRVPIGDVLAGTVQTSGPGVAGFISTTVSSASSSGWGIAPLTDPASAAAGHWLVPIVPAALAQGVSLVNTSSSPDTVSVMRVTPQGLAPISGLGAITIPAGSFFTLPRPSIGPFEVSSSGPLGVAQSFNTAAAQGVATMLGLPFSSDG